MLNSKFVSDIINGDLNPKIKWAREKHDKLALHIDGVGIQEYLSKINGYENEAQYEARKKHAISNKFIVEELLRPTDNAFNARGGSKNYKFDSNAEQFEKELTNKLAEIRNSKSLNKYIEDEWFHKFLTDPNGLVVIEADVEETEPEDRVAYPTYKSIYSIRDYQQNGSFVDWVIFEPHEEVVKSKNPLSKAEETIKLFWALDKENWYLYSQDDESLALLKIVEHGFDKVPAMLCSDITDSKTGMKKSPIDAQVELLDKYMVQNSVLNIVEFFHNYPQQFAYVDECNRCNGSGNIGTPEEWKSCPDCDNGKLEKKDPTDIWKLRVPKADEVKIDPPAGYIYMPTEPWDLMVSASDRTWNRMFFSHWGTVVSREGKNETATGRFIDAQPVNNRLNKYSKSIENAHQILANFIGEFHFPTTFKGAFIQYGRRYLIETPDQIWEKYLTAKKQDAPVSTLDILLSQYLESEYRENEQMFIVETKKAKLEPFVHWSIKSVRESDIISIKEKAKKEYYGEWVMSISVEDIFSKPLETLKEELDNFVGDKIKNLKDEGNIQQDVRQEEQYDPPVSDE